MSPMAIGSRPENGSSSTSRSGSFTSAAISWTRCWLPCDRVSRRSLGAVGEVEALEPRIDAAAHIAPGRSAELAEVEQLLSDPHARVEAALLGHVAEPHPLSGPDAGAPPRHRAGIQLDQAEHHTHGGGLARAVGSEEAGEPSGTGGERAAVERRQRTEPLGGPVELEHHSPLPPV